MNYTNLDQAINYFSLILSLPCNPIFLKQKFYSTNLKDSNSNKNLKSDSKNLNS
jgi:hypothetical protein